MNRDILSNSCGIHDLLMRSSRHFYEKTTKPTEAMASQDFEALTLEELRVRLCRMLHRPVPTSTLRRWLSEKYTGFGIRDEYTHADAEAIAFFDRQLRRRRKVQYAREKLNDYLLLKHEQSNQTDTARTIEVEARSV